MRRIYETDSTEPYNRGTDEHPSSRRRHRGRGPVCYRCSSDAAGDAFNNGNDLYDEGRFEDAVAAYSEAIALEPDPETLASAYVYRSFALLFLDRNDEALEDATAAIALEPDPETLASAHTRRAHALSNLGRPDEAIDNAAVAIALEPADTETLASAYAIRAAGLTNLGRLDAAIEHATVAIALEPADTETLAIAYMFRGLALINSDRGAEATADLERVTTLLPSRHWIHVRAAEILTNRDKTK